MKKATPLSDATPIDVARTTNWDKGKNCETFNPFGPWIATGDELGDPQDLSLRLWANGDLRQDGNTKNMIFSIDHVVWYLSQFMTLYPGDVINTGTPAGVAMGRADKPYLRRGIIPGCPVHASPRSDSRAVHRRPGGKPFPLDR
jgi:2-keto-4-pentenoate hydratase/2-oxohepta-3-ene-1,7-dioic acid hydratase in catechol pathway